jgi:hypothetical protein
MKGDVMKNFLSSRKLAVVLAIFALLSFGCNDDKDKDSGGIPGGEGTASIAFTHVPAMGTSEDLSGRVLHVSPADHRVVVYICVAGSWWIKPYWADPTTIINDDGTWTCDVTTGGNDAYATDYVAYVIAADYTPDSSYDEATMEANSVASAYTTR